MLPLFISLIFAGDISDDNMSTSGNGELDLEIPHMHVDVDESLVQQLVRSANSIDNPAKYFAEFFIKVFPVGEVGFAVEHEQQYFTSVGCWC